MSHASTNFNGSRFTLRARFNDGRVKDLGDMGLNTQTQAERAADRYVKDYADPFGLGTGVESVTIVDRAQAGVITGRLRAAA